MAGAGAGAGARNMNKGGARGENKKFRLRNTLYMLFFYTFITKLNPV